MSMSKLDRATKRQITRLACGAILLVAGLLLGRSELPAGIPLAVFLAGYLLLGADVIWRAARSIARGKVFSEHFLMTIATIGALAIGQPAEAVAVMLFYQVGEFFQDLAVDRSKRSITSLMAIRPDRAQVQRRGRLIEVSPDTVKVGELILVKPGERIPLDGRVLAGESLLDTSALTGEPVPLRVSTADTVLAGCVNQTGMLTISVTRPASQSTVNRIIDLVQNAAQRKAPTEAFISRFARIYTPVVVGLAALVALAGPLIFGASWSVWTSRALVFLVVSCPCALVISVPLTFFAGVGGAARKGILVKGGNYLEALDRLEIIVFDKTGTLTKGSFEVTALYPASGVTEEQLLRTAASAEAFSLHPIAQSLMRARGVAPDMTTCADPVEIAGQGVSATVAGVRILVGNDLLMRANRISCKEPDARGTTVHVAAAGAYLGSIVIADELKEDSRAALVALRARGVRRMVMLTGDDQRSAEAVARDLDIDEIHGGLLPQDKVERVERLLEQVSPKGKLAVVGDGINDAPVLARADVGIAMGALGADAAIEAADIVLMTDEPSKLVEAIDSARSTRRIVWQNIILALAIKVVFMILGTLGLASMWEAVFADVGVSVLAILNATRALR